MRSMAVTGFAVLAGLFATGLAPVHADSDDDDIRRFSTEGAFEDVFFDVEDGIVNRGYVIDYVAHIGEMLDRTSADVGATRSLYRDARTLQFCSAVLSRKAMEADPANIAYCPYAIFVYELADEPGTVTVGFRPLTDDDDDDDDDRASRAALSAVDDLLEDIAREATDER